MAISGTYYVKMLLPHPALVHGVNRERNISQREIGPEEDFFEGEITFHFTPNPDGTLSGDADGTPINFGFYTGDQFFKVDFPAGPGRWEIWAQVEADGTLSGMVSVGGNKGFPNRVYGKKVD